MAYQVLLLFHISSGVAALSLAGLVYSHVLARRIFFEDLIRNHLFPVLCAVSAFVIFSGSGLAILSPEVSARSMCAQLFVYSAVVLGALFVGVRNERPLPLVGFPSLAFVGSIGGFVSLLALGV